MLFLCIALTEARIDRLKGGLLATFFLLFGILQPANANNATTDLATLARNPAWLALIQDDHTNSRIHDPAFILSQENYSALHELQATIALLQQNPVQVCNFPARRNFIAANLPFIALAELDTCTDYQEYIHKVPVDEISLIYASENLGQPSSIMGHIMLRLSGLDENQQLRSHGVSFFTELNGINVPKIMWQTLYSGQTGFFQITPYSEKENYYIFGEQRNVWEYTLAFNTAQRDIIRDYIWELHQAKLDYLFTTYNCATLTLLILAAADSAAFQVHAALITPLDVSKQARDAGYISSISLVPADKWQTRMLLDSVSDDIKQQIYTQKKSPQLQIGRVANTQTETFLALEFALSYNHSLYQAKEINQEIWQQKNADISRQTAALQDTYQLDLSQYKNPLNTPDDSQWSIGLLNMNNTTWLSANIMPAAHAIEDDNRQFFSENELKLSSLTLITDTTTGHSEIYDWQLFATQSLNPWDKYTRNISSYLQAGINRQLDDNGKFRRYASLAGGMGFTGAVSRDLYTYALLGAAINYAQGDSDIYLEPQLGAYLYEVFDMKSSLRLSQRMFKAGRKNQRIVEFNQTLYTSVQGGLFMNLQQIDNGHERQGIYAMKFKRYF